MPPGKRQPRVWTVSAAPGDLAAGGADRSGGVSGNARLTSSTGALLLLLLAAEGATIPFIGPLLGAHVFIGMLLVPPVAVKMGSTGYKIVRYYTGSVPYRLAGPPPLVRRLLGPLVVAATIVVLATGIALVLARPGSAETFLQLHKLSFIVWVCAHDGARAHPPPACRAVGYRGMDGPSARCRRPGGEGARTRAGLRRRARARRAVPEVGRPLGTVAHGQPTLSTSPPADRRGGTAGGGSSVQPLTDLRGQLRPAIAPSHGRGGQEQRSRMPSGRTA